jgi:hypothetical protein
MGSRDPAPGILLLFVLSVADCQGRIFAVTLGEAADFTTRPWQQTTSAAAAESAAETALTFAPMAIGNPGRL